MCLLEVRVRSLCKRTFHCTSSGFSMGVVPKARCGHLICKWQALPRVLHASVQRTLCESISSDFMLYFWFHDSLR
jgi:hypothetical protein